MRGKPPEEVIMDLVVEDQSRVGTVYFMMSEDNIRKQIALPWVSFGSDRRVDGARAALHEVQYSPSARTATSRACSASMFARRRPSRSRSDPQTVRPARHEPRPGPTRGPQAPHVRRRRGLRSGDDRRHPRPSRSPSVRRWMKHVFVNGVQVLKDGEHTGAKPGRACGAGKRN